MTNVRVRLLDSDGTPIDSTGEFLFAPSKPVATDTGLRLPSPFSVRVRPGAAVTVDLAPTGPDWYWKVTEKVAGGRLRSVVVPDSALTLEYEHLTEVDPKSYSGGNPPKAWDLRMEELEHEVEELALYDLKGVVLNQGDAVPADLPENSLVFYRA